MRHFSLLFAAVLSTASAGVWAAEISAWFAPGTLKIMRDAKPAAGPLTWDLAAARNEVEACQLILASDEPVQGLNVTVAQPQDIKENGGLKWSLFRVEYVPVKREKIPFPDPLPPMAGPLDLQAHQAQPVWISVRVPKDTPAGTYRVAIKLTQGTWLKELPLSIRVWDFTLPDTPACVTAFGNSPAVHLAPWHGVNPDSPEAKELARKYYEILLDHRLSPMFIPADLMAEEAVPYLRDPRMTSYVIPYEADDGKLKALVQRLLDGGWFAKGFFYVVDEPVKKEVYDQLVAVTDRLRKIEPRYRLVAPFYSNPDFGDKTSARELMLGRVNVWCPHSDYLYSEPGIRKFLQGRMNAGESIWWYVCNNPRAPRNNLHIDMDAMSHRTLPWQQKREGLQGLLYWHTTYWEKKFVQDPWQEMDTIGTGYYGDGSLLYPGKRVGINGPVTSVRLEVLRDGLEDYDYLALADRWLGPEFAQAHVARIARGLTDFEHDPLKLEAVRRELGAALEKAAAAPRGN